MKDESLEQAVGKQEADVKDEDKTQAQIANGLEASTAGREQLEREIEERRLYLESVLACAPDAIVTLDAEHNIQEWNPGAEKLFGYTSAEAAGRNIDTLITRPGTDVFEEATGFTHRVLSGKSIPPVETVRYCKDGSAVDVIVSGSPILLGGKVVGVVAVYTDVTERRWTEEALRDSEERFRALSEASFEAIFLSEKGICFGQNLAAEKMFGYTLSEAVGRSGTEWIAPEHREMVEGNMLSGHEEPYRATALRRDGSTFPVEIQGKMMRYRGREVRVTALRDITARVQAEEALAMRVEQLTALSQASRAVTASLEVDQVLGEIASLASKVTASDYATVLLLDEAGRVDQSAEDLPGVLSIEYRARDGGLTEWIARSGQAAIIDEIGEDGAISPPLGKGAPHLANPHVVAAGVKAVAGLPLISRGNLLGLIYLHSLRPGAFRGQLPVLTAFANQAAIAIQNARLYKEAQDEIAERKQVETALRESERQSRTLFTDSQRQAQELALLDRVRTALATELDLSVVFHTVVEAIAETYGYTLVSLYLLQGDVLALQHQVGYDQMIERIPITQGVSGQVARTGEPVLLKDVRTDATFLGAIEGVVSEVCVPLFDQGQVVGTLNVESTKGVALEEDDLRLITALGEHVNIAIGRARLHTEVRESEERYRSLFDGVPVGLYRITPAGEFVDGNPALVQILGCPDRETLLACNALDMHLVVSDRQSGKALAEREGVLLDFETQVRRYDGAIIWVRDTSRVVRDADGRVLYYDGRLEDITRRKQAEDEIRQKSEDLSLINLMNSAANRGNSLQEIVQLLAQETKRMFSTNGATVYLLSEDGEHLVMQNLVLPPAMAARVEKLIGTKIPAINIPLQAGSVYRQVLEAGQAQIVNDPDEIRRLMAQFVETVHPPNPLRRVLRELIPRIYEVLGIQSVINVPLVSEGEVIGLLDISRAEPFTESDLRRFEAIAGQLTAIVERKRAEEALRASEEYARSIIENSLDTIITVDVGRRIVEFNEAAQETFGYRAEEILGKHIDVLYLDPQEGVEVHWTTVEQGQCLREVSALRKNGEIFPSLISASALRNARGELMGVMGISRDISERKRAEESLRQRNRELSVLNRAGQALTSSLDLDQILDTVLDEVRRLLNVTACSVWLIEPETGDLVCLQAATPRDEVVRGWRLAPGEGICGWVAHHGESLVVPDAWADERYYSGVDEETGLGLRSILTMPLRVKEDVIGALQVLDTRVGRFGKTDLELLEPLVASAAIAIENARLYEEARQRVAGLEALQRTSLQLTSTLDLSAVLNTIAESSLTMTEATDCHIYLYDEASETFTFGAAFWENGRREAAVETPRCNGFTAAVAREGQALVINDASRHPLYATPETREWGVRAIVGFPLQRAGQVLGVFTIAFLTAHTFNEEELGILGLLADQAAIAVENARLYEETARRLAQTEVLREMMLAAASTLDFDQVLERTIEVLEQEIGVEYLGFMLPDEGGEFMKSHPYILGFTPPPGGVFRYPTDRCVTGQVYRTGEPVILSDVREAARYAVAAPEVRSELAVPVEIGDRVMAVLNLESSKPNAFGEEELAFYTAVARQLGVAMENARLYEQARQDAETKATLLREVNHRVKNNLTAIIGLLHAERRHTKMEEQPTYQAIMQSLVGRVQGLATVHSMLSASEWSPLSLSDLAAQVTHSSLQMLPPDRRVAVDVAPSPVRVTPDQAHNLALVINELVTNSVKHGLREQRSIRIGARIQLDGDAVLLEFRDNGPGYPPDVLRLEHSGVGFDLIQNIVRKNLRGELSLRNDRGAVAAIRFKAEA